MDNREYANNLDDPAYVEAGQMFGMNGEVIEFQPFPPVDSMPTDRTRSWNNDLMELRNQFPFVQIDPPITQAFKFHLNAATPVATYIQIPPSAQMMRVTFASNNANCTLGLSTAEINTDTANYENVQYIINPTSNWRYCRNTSQIVVWPVSMSGTGLIRGTVEFFSQL